MTNVFYVQLTVDMFTMEDKLLVNVFFKSAPHQAFDKWQQHVDCFKVAVNYLTDLMTNVDLIAY